MAPYRLHILNGGEIESVIPFDVEDDMAAQHFAATQRYGRAAELWGVDRLVGRYPERSRRESKGRSHEG